MSPACYAGACRIRACAQPCGVIEGKGLLGKIRRTFSDGSSTACQGICRSSCAVRSSMPVAARHRTWKGLSAHTAVRRGSGLPSMPACRSRLCRRSPRPLRLGSCRFQSVPPALLRGGQGNLWPTRRRVRPSAWNTRSSDRTCAHASCPHLGCFQGWLGSGLSSIPDPGAGCG